MIANTGGAIIGIPNPPADMNHAFVPTKPKANRTFTIMATTLRCSRQFIGFFTTLRFRAFGFAGFSSFGGEGVRSKAPHTFAAAKSGG